jgi:hypothetical protein
VHDDRAGRCMQVHGLRRVMVSVASIRCLPIWNTTREVVPTWLRAPADCRSARRRSRPRSLGI